MANLCSCKHDWITSVIAKDCPYPHAVDCPYCQLEAQAKEIEGFKELQTLLYSGVDVYVKLTDRQLSRTTADNVSDTLDAMNKAWRQCKAAIGQSVERK